MNRIASFLALVLLIVTGLLTSVLLSGCTNSRSSGDGGDRSAIVTGTVIDAATGRPEANAKVEGPDGRTARTDEHGRFQLKGLPVGSQGEVKATASEGRSAHVPLRPLSAGKLEIVLHLVRR